MRLGFRHLAAAAVLFAGVAICAQAKPAKDARLAGAYKFQRGGWTYVHLQGTPEQIGFQHGYLLGPQIADALHVFRVEDEHSTHRNWGFYRNAAKTIFWPHIEPQYQAELKGIAEGAEARGVKVDVWDIVARERHDGTERVLRSVAQ